MHNDEEKKQIHHTGTGRIAKLVMRTMSLWESGDSNGSVSLKDLFESPERIEGISDKSLDDIAFLCCRGGWPETLEMRREVVLEQAFDHIDAVADSDIQKADKVNRDPDQVRRQLRSYARNQGSQSPLTTLRDDMKANESTTSSDDTVGSYVNALKKYM